MIKTLSVFLNGIMCCISIVCAILIFNSCSERSDQIDDTSVFRYNEHKNIGSLDPAFSKDIADIWATNQLFDGLVKIDDQMNVLPCIAKSWDISEDALTYTFLLRNNVKFHKHVLFGKDSTRTVTASDFEFSLNRLTNIKLASPGSWVLQKVDGYKALNDSIFEIKLKQPFPAFLGLLTMKYCSVVPKEIVAHYGNDFRSHPIGTGPFKFQRWEENLKLVFRKNTDYFETDRWTTIAIS